MKKSLLILLLPIAAYLPLHAQDTTLTKTDSVVVVATDTAMTMPMPVTTTKKWRYDPVYKVNLGADIPITAAAAGWSLYAFTKIYSKDNSTEEQIAALDEKNVPAFDRWAIRPYSEKIDRESYIPFYAAMPAPLLLLLDKRIRKDGVKVMFLYLEAMSITGLMYTSSMYLTNRYRPYVYRNESPWDKRVTGNAKNSFYAGHVHLVATSVFFIAKVWSDYHPESHIKWLFYTGASAVTAWTALMRHQAGMHFPSDLALGAGLGIATGILVPALHKNKSADDRVSLYPNFGINGSKGVTLVYNIR